MIVDISKKILIVGLGLLGGSYAKALKRFGFHISAITKEQSSIDYALKEKIIDEGTTEIDDKIIGESDLVIFALYPHVFVEWIRDNQHLLKRGALITDVTGVKGSVVYKIQDMLRSDVEFIAAHPMAGREVSGVKTAQRRCLLVQIILSHRPQRIHRKQYKPVWSLEDFWASPTSLRFLRRNTMK